MKYLYKYPQAAYPYSDLVDTNRRRGRKDLEYELLDTGIFDEDRYFDIFVEYAKQGPTDILIQISISIAALNRPRFISCPRCGSAISGAGGRNRQGRP